MTSSLLRRKDLVRDKRAHMLTHHCAMCAGFVRIVVEKSHNEVANTKCVIEGGDKENWLKTWLKYPAKITPCDSKCDHIGLNEIGAVLARFN